MKVLIALDDSPYSAEVVADVMKRNWSDNTHFKLLTVVEPLCRSCDDEDSEMSELSNVLHRKRWQRADSICEKVSRKFKEQFPHLDVDFEVIEGNPRSEILEAALNWSADRLILGAHGKDVCPHNLLGSVSQFVASHSPCSVEIIRSKSRHKTLPAEEKAVSKYGQKLSR